MRILRDALVYGTISSSIISVGAVAFTLQFGISNVINLAFGAMMTIAAFTMYWLLGSPIGIPGAVVTALLLGAIGSLAMYRLLLRPFIRRGSQVFHLAMVTIALGIVIQYSIEAYNRGVSEVFQLPLRGTVYILGLSVDVVSAGVVIVALLSLLLVGYLLRLTKLGLAMRATAENPEIARVCGVKTERVRYATWLISGALCALAGIVLGLSYATITPGFGTNYFFTIVAAVIFGGIGRPSGAVIGAFALGMTGELVADLGAPGYQDVVSFGVIIAVMLVRPAGLLGTSVGFARVRD